MTTSCYPQGCSTGSQEHGNTAARWVVDFNNGNVNNNHRNNNACVRAVRAGEYQGDGEVSLKELHAAWKNARRGKKASQNQLSFDSRWADGLLDLQQRINAGSWEPGRSACFVAAKPKAREIHAPDFTDRVVHHWLVPQLEAMWEPLFIFDSYANRRGKGSHAAVRRLQSFVRQVERGQGGGWYLQLDIHNFFNSIHRPTLWNILKDRLIKARATGQVLRITHALLRRHPLYAGAHHHSSPTERAMVPEHKRLANAKPGCGLPIGNLSSQFFANVYLDRLDQFVKHTLKSKRYLRYVDDFVLVHKDRSQLEAWQQQIETFLGNELRLGLKPDIKLRRITDGIDFLGYVIRPTHTLARRRVVASAKQKLAEWEQRHVIDGIIVATPEQLHAVRSILASYRGHLRHANSQRLQQILVARFPWILTVDRRRRFDYRLEDRPVRIPILQHRTTGRP